MTKYAIFKMIDSGISYLIGFTRSNDPVKAWQYLVGAENKRQFNQKKANAIKKGYFIDVVK